MKKYKVAVTKYGFAIVDAENPEEALKTAKKLDDEDFTWENFQDPEIMEEIEKECASPSYKHITDKEYKNLKRGDEVYVMLHGQIALVTIEDFLPFSNKFTAKFTDKVFGPEDVFEECDPGYDLSYLSEERE